MSERLDHLLKVGDMWLADDSILDYIGAQKRELAEKSARIKELELIKFNWNDEIQPLKDRIKELQSQLTELEVENVKMRKALEKISWQNLNLLTFENARDLAQEALATGKEMKP